MTDFFSPEQPLVQGTGFLDTATSVNQSGVLAQQVLAFDPTMPTLEQHTGMLATDMMTEARVRNFDPDQYDLSDQSHLMRFLRVLLGEAGVGQIRKRYTTARLQQTMSGTHFYDLDGFWGSILSVSRRPEEQLPDGDPMVTNYTQDQWDDIYLADALFRERIIALAKGVAMGGTISSFYALAEAILRHPVEVYEGWAEVGAATPSPGNTWGQVQSKYTTWGAAEMNGQVQNTWGVLQNRVQMGITGLNSPDEVWIVPRKNYNTTQSSTFEQAGREELRSDVTDVESVFQKVGPANVLVTLSPDGIISDTQVGIGGVYADSEFWQVTNKVIPNTSLNLASNPYAEGQPATGYPGVVLPNPAHTNSQTVEWFYNINIKSANAFHAYDADKAAPGFQDQAKSWATADGGRLFGGNYESLPTAGSVVGQKGARVTKYTPAWAIEDPLTLLLSLGSKGTVLQVAPYSAPRTVTPTYG